MRLIKEYEMKTLTGIAKKHLHIFVASKILNLILMLSSIIWQRPLLAQRKVFLLASIDMTRSSSLLGYGHSDGHGQWTWIQTWT